MDDLRPGDLTHKHAVRPRKIGRANSASAGLSGSLALRGIRHETRDWLPPASVTAFCV
jgi:hypothetical protein